MMLVAAAVMSGTSNPAHGAVSASPAAATPTACTKEAASGPDNPLVKPATPGDFNGDGRADLAVLSFYEEEQVGSRAGEILYSDPWGAPVCQQLLTVKHPSSDGTLTSGDFNGDGRADLVISSPALIYRYLTVRYASQRGLLKSRTKVLHSKRNSIGGAMVTADFNDDGYSDLAAGAPHWDGSQPPRRNSKDEAIVIYWGSAHGLHHKDKKVIKPPNRTTTWFGSSLLAGDVTGDGYPDLIESYKAFTTDTKHYPLEHDRILFLKGSAHGPHNPAKVSRRDGREVLGDVTGDGVDDLVVSTAAGLEVLTGTHHGLSHPRLVPDTASLPPITALLDVTGDGHDDAILGDGPRTVDGHKYAGGFTVLPGTGDGFDLAAAEDVDQSSDGVPGCPSNYSQFGSVATARDLNGDGRLDLLVWNPGFSKPRCARAALVAFMAGPTSFASASKYVAGRAREDIGAWV
jgi:hypothetical protein